MSEKIRHSAEGNDASTEHTSHEVRPNRAEHQHDARNEAVDLEKSRELLDETYKSRADKLDESAHSATKILGVSLPSPEPVIESLTKTLATIRQSLSPSEKFFSKLIHNPAISNASDFTANTLARPFAILAGGAVSLVGSAAYLYYTRHFGYQYNYFVPILLFAAGLAAGMVTELVYKTLTIGRKR